MVKRLFNCISICCHPIFAATLGIMLLTSRLLSISTKAHWVLVLFCLGYTVLLPMAFIGIARMVGFVNDFQMRSRKERIFSLIITGICVYSLSYVFKGWLAPTTIRAFTLGISIMIFLATLLSTFSHISLHAIGWGGLTALVSYFSFSQPNLTWLLALTVLLSGLVGTARLYLGEHKPIQVYSGYVIGFITIWTTFIINSL